MGEVLVDEAFIQLEENRPNLALTVDDDDLPVIDLSNLKDEASVASVAAQIGHACRTWGFFQVINHGVADEVIENILADAGKFFELPLEEKRKVGNDLGKKQLGFGEPDQVWGVTQWREGFDYLVIGSEEDKELTNQWPEYPPEFRKRALKFTHETEKLGMRMIRLVSLSLGLPAGKLSDKFEPSPRRYTKFHHCPPCPAPHLALGVSPHEDHGALTLLVQDEVGGLEVKRKADGEWIRIRPIPNAYVVNVGHMIEAWTNGEYVSVTHRIKLNPEKGRLSCLLFFNPIYGTIIGPLAEVLKGESPNPKYEPYPLGNYFAKQEEVVNN